VTRLQYGTGWGCKAKNPMDALTADRIQFAFTLVFHYLFPQLTMGLALLILILKTIALRTANEECLGANSALNLPWRNRFRAQGMGPSTPSVGAGSCR
jgi:Cytochrome bd terminal oxidase subunit I